MSHHPTDHRPLLLFGTGALSGALGLALCRQLLSSDDRGLELFAEVRDIAAASYVQDVPADELTLRALEGMVGGLDPYSKFLRGTEAKRVERETSGVYRGLGIVFRSSEAPDQVLFALADSPADRAGLRPGDRVLTIAGRRMIDLDRAELSLIVQRAGDHLLRLEVQRRGGAIQGIEIESASIPEPSVRHVHMSDLGLGIGYVALTSFTRRSPDEFDRALEQLDAQGMRALVLDLRANPGGVLEAAVEIANRFVSEGPITTTQSRSERRVYEADRSQARRAALPLVVLVDGSSASASEILAGAFQDHRAAVIVGEPTYGKTAVQTVTCFPEHSAAVRLTTALYLTPAGRSFRASGPSADGPSDATAAAPAELVGLEPDVWVELAPEAQSRIHRWLASYDPPAGPRAEIEAWEQELGRALLPAPGDDPQLAQALALFRGERPAARPAAGELPH